jgi:hypothetical protein
MDAGDEFRCECCGDLIGVYEPLVMCANGLIRITSRAAEPDLGAMGATHYHRACYTAEVDDG